MEIKEEDIYNKLLCLACLCTGRDMYKITNEKLLKYFTDVLDEIPLNKSMKLQNVRVCWECKILLQKCWAFKEQIKDSYRIMQSYTSDYFHECFYTDVTKPPRITIHSLDSIDIPPAAKEYCDSLLDVKNELENGEFQDDVTNYDIDTLSSTSTEQNRIFETDLQNIICPIKEKKRSRIKNRVSKSKKTGVKLKRTKNDLSVGPDDVKVLSIPPSDTEEFCKEPELIEIKGELGETWTGHKDTTNEMPDNQTELTNNIYNDNKLETELQSLISSIEKEDKVKKRSRIRSKQKISNKIVKRLKLKTPKQNYDSKIVTVELTYEEMMAEREKEMTKDGYLKSEYKCETCIIGFNYGKSYQAHVNSRHLMELGEYICPICKTIISSVDSFTTHYKRHMRRYECSICQKRTADLKVMQQHFYTTHEISLKEYKCNICGKISNSIETHRYHKDSHKPRVECTECDKTFRHRAGLMNHRVAVHEFHNAFPCNVCDKVFRWKTSLKRHLEKHDAKATTSHNMPYCTECSITFASICSYQRHMKNSLKHVTQEQHKFICDHCKRRFADKTKLRDHIEEKHLFKTYQCHICAKQSKNRVGLDQHIRNVHKGRPKNKMCHHCGRGFPTKMQLESHIRTHTGERPFICEYCPTTFSQKSNLNKHNRQVHLNIKSKRYPLCKKRKEDVLNKVAIENGVIENDVYRPIIIQYSPENPQALML